MTNKRLLGFLYTDIVLIVRELGVEGCGIKRVHIKGGMCGHVVVIKHLG